ncbi:mutanase [Cryptococcus deuterogattii CA1014]|nr:mutanase [Cryptococcus deuterogattii CA1014]
MLSLNSLITFLLSAHIVTAHNLDFRHRNRHARRALKRQQQSAAGHWSTYETSTWIQTVWKDGPSPVTPQILTESSPTQSTSGSGSTWTGEVGVDNLVATDHITSSAAPSTSNLVVTLAPSSAEVAIGSSSNIAIFSTATAMTVSLDSSNLKAEIDGLGFTISIGETFSIGFGDGSSPTTTSSAPASTLTTSGDKKVFAHFMVGIVSTYAISDWESDMQLAKSKGIDGFALNIGVDWYSQEQLDLAYQAGASVGFDLFISFDFNWYTVANVSGVAEMLKRYKDQSAQFRVDNKPFVSTFIGDGFDWSSVATEVGEELYAVPFWQPSADNANNAGLSGLFSWDAWPGQLDNVPVNTTMSDIRDIEISATLKLTHFGAEVSYSKNWVFKSETLWKDRWDEILRLGSRLDFIEIVTWNDYGESHYIGPYNTPHTDDSSSAWAAGLDHTAMLDFAIPYIKAFKAGEAAPVIEEEMLVYWYRPHFKSASCDSTDNCGSKPTGWDFLGDTVFVAAMTKSGGTVKVTSGNNQAVVQRLDAGVQMIEVPMGVGEQTFEFVTFQGGYGKTTSNVTISADCWNGIYNFNYHSGSITC